VRKKERAEEEEEEKSLRDEPIDFSSSSLLLDRQCFF